MSESLPADYGDSLMTVADFVVRYPHLYPKANRVRWLLRDRGRNGLLSRGAVVEVYANGQKRPALFIYPPEWFAWMRDGGSHAPRNT